MAMFDFGRRTMASLKNYLLNLNIFATTVDSDGREDEQKHRSNRIATRIYFVVLTLALINIATVSWLSLQTTTITIRYPTKDQFEKVPADAQCSCSRISISYGEFSSLQPTFHSVCSSDFVSDRWIKAIFSGTNTTYFSLTDFRTFGSAQFRALAGFCRLTKASVQQSITAFYQNILISSQVKFKDVLQLQTKEAIKQMKQIASNMFEPQLKLVRRMTTGNKLITGLQTNDIITYVNRAYGQYAVETSPVSYQLDNGSFSGCFTDVTYKFPAGFYDTFGAPTQWDAGNMTMLPGISSGCLPVNSILVSTLECFYNQTCLDELISFFPTPEKFSAMVIVKRSRFARNSTVQSMIDVLMVEEWTEEISYDKYYARCAPLSCTYSKLERHGLVFVLTKLISLLGGFSLFTFQVTQYDRKENVRTA
jgi:hypothetical protein